MPEPGGGQDPPTVSPPRVKICGLTRRADAAFAAQAGADYLGVILVPGTPRAVSVSQGRELTRGLGVEVVGVLANPALEDAAAWALELGASVVQLHGEESPEFIRRLRQEGSWKIWKAVRVRDPRTLSEDLSVFSPLVDGILLDSWHPRRRGGTGRPFSWEEVEVMRDGFPEGIDLIAAGGLRPENVQEAVRRLRPRVVDVSSGVEEAPGIKDPERVAAFLKAAGKPGKGGR